MNPQDPYRQTPEQQQPASPLNQNLGQDGPQPVNQPYANPYPPLQHGVPGGVPSAPQPLGSIQTPNADDPYPADYLDRIAVPQTQRTASKFAVFGLIFGFLTLVAVAAFLLVSGTNSTPNFSSQAKIVQGRILTLQSVANEHTPHLSDNRLRATNATFVNTLTTLNLELGNIMKANDIKALSKPEGDEATYQKELQTKLNDSYMLGTIDRTFASEMAYEIELLKTQLKRLTLKSESKTVTEYYDKSLSSLVQAQEEFSAFAGDK